MPVFDTPEPIAAAIDVGSGRIRVTASDRADTVIEVRPHNEERAKDVEAAEQIQVEYVRGRLTVKMQRKWVRELFGTGPSVDIDLELPEGSQLDVSAYGSVDCTGRLGNVTIETAAGDVRVERAADLRLKTSAGDITVGRIDGHGDVNASAGAVRIDEVAGTAVAKASTGELTVDEATGDVRLNSAYGDIRVGRVHASAVVKTAYGRLRVAEAVSGSIVLDTSYGDLDVGIAEGTAAWLDVSSKNGVVRTDLDAADSPADIERTVEVRARTQHGDVTVRRA